MDPVVPHCTHAGPRLVAIDSGLQRFLAAGHPASLTLPITDSDCFTASFAGMTMSL